MHDASIRHERNGLGSAVGKTKGLKDAHKQAYRTSDAIVFSSKGHRVITITSHANTKRHAEVRKHQSVLLFYYRGVYYCSPLIRNATHTHIHTTPHSLPPAGRKLTSDTSPSPHHSPSGTMLSPVSATALCLPRRNAALDENHSLFILRCIAPMEIC